MDVSLRIRWWPEPPFCLRVSWWPEPPVFVRGSAGGRSHFFCSRVCWRPEPPVSIEGQLVAGATCLFEGPLVAGATDLFDEGWVNCEVAHMLPNVAKFVL